jgi:hypothetical protein
MKRDREAHPVKRAQLRTFGDWLTWDEEFSDWLCEACTAVLVREDYFEPALFKHPAVVKVPVDFLDRHEVLLVFKRQPVMSVSWNMPLVVTWAKDGIRLIVARGWSNCIVCRYPLSLRPGGVLCIGQGQLAIANTDLGLCPSFKPDAGPFQVLPVPRWWMDSDWLLCSYRYQSAAFNRSAVERVVARQTPKMPVRYDPLPKTLAEQAGPTNKGLARGQPVSKEAWLEFYRQMLPDEYREPMIEMARGKPWA